MACASECGEGINPVPTATLQEARDATSWRGGTTDALWFQTMNVYNAGVVVVDTYCGDFALEHLDGEGFTWQGQRADARKT